MMTKEMQAMIRTIVQLTEVQAAALKRLATRRGVSVSELVRQGVDRVLADDERAARRARLMELAGKYSGPPDLAARHDDYLAETYAMTSTAGEGER
jgi:Arc/MetJ-type ribon-helix-helix transcriptional regulator